MALSATVVWEVELGGDDSNGGGFNSASGGTDWSLFTTPHVNIDAVNVTATCNAAVITFVGGVTPYSPVAGDVGNVVHMITGTGLTPSWYQINSVVPGTSWTLDRTTGMSGGAVTSAKMGGCFGSPGGLGLVLTTVTVGVTNQRAFIKAATYPITSATANISGGAISPGANQYFITGYSVTRTTNNTDTTHPLLQASGITTATLMALSSAYGAFINVDVDGAGLVAIRGTTTGLTGGLFLRCRAFNCTNSGFVASNANSFAVNCIATGCTTTGAAFNTIACFGCEAYSNSVAGFSSAIVVNCLSYNNTGAADGFDLGARGQFVINCIAYGNAGAGFNLSAGGQDLVIGCIAEANTGKGFLNAGISSTLMNCATFNNTGGSNDSTNPMSSIIVGTVGSFFVNAGALNFALNNLVNQGALLRTTNSTFNSFMHSIGLGYLDIGPLQHQDSPNVDVFVIDD